MLYVRCLFQAGENVVNAFSNMLNRIKVRSKAVGMYEDLGALFKERMLDVLCVLLSTAGAIVCRRGPLDAQIAFVSFLQEYEFINVGFSQTTDIVIKLGALIFPRIT